MNILLLIIHNGIFIYQLILAKFYKYTKIPDTCMLIFWYLIKPEFLIAINLKLCTFILYFYRTPKKFTVHSKTGIN